MDEFNSYINITKINNGYTVQYDRGTVYCKTLAKVNKQLKKVFEAIPDDNVGNIVPI